MVDNDELISVIVPIYNVEKYLRKCIDSISNQTYRNLEIILVDDGSPDNCGKICDEYAKEDKRIRVIHKKNGGLSDARNAGIDIATGKYITFIDSDDYIENDYVNYLYDLIKKYNCDISICAYKLKVEDKINDFGKKYCEEKMTTEKCLERMLCERGFTVSAWAKMYKSDLFNDVRFPIGKICEDNGTTYKLIKKCKNIIYGNIGKYIYIVRDDSIMNSKFSLKKMDLIELTDIMAEELDKDFPILKDAIIKRKMQSRFSVLRQILFSCDKENMKIAVKIRKELIKEYWRQIFVNRKLDFRDRIAFVSLLCGLTFYKNNWKIYLKLKYMKGEGR